MENLTNLVEELIDDIERDHAITKTEILGNYLELFYPFEVNSYVKSILKIITQPKVKIL